MTLRNAKAKTLWNRADAADKAFQEGRAKLFRPDGTKLYSDEEHEEQEAQLASERNKAARAVEQEVERESARAREELGHLQSEDPTRLLSTEELTSASSRREFVNDDVAALSEGELVSRIESVLAGGDRVSMSLFWQAGRRKKAEIIEGRREQLRKAGRPVEAAATPYELSGP